MTRGWVFAIGLLAVIAAAACVSRAPLQPPESALKSSASPNPILKTEPCASPAPVALQRPAVGDDTGCPETPARLRANVAVGGFGRASANEEFAHFAMDGNPDSSWNAELHPVQWLSVSLDGLYLTDGIELDVAQTPAGRTTHELWLGHPSGTQTLYKRFTDVYTEQGQTLAVDFEPPVRINEVMILTLSGPSWVAWREVRVFGVKAGKAEEAVEAPRWKLNKISGGLDKPVHVTHAGDGSGRTFVVEHPGRIRIIKDGVLSDIPFLDITDRVRCCGEEGLVGLAFAPTYTSSQQFYVGYTNAQGATTISRFATTSDPDIADPASEEVLLTVNQPRDNHNGGHLAFGPRDGYLYIGSGDGGEAGVVVTTGQERDSLLGKILRIDVESGVKPYGIPPGNPFAQSTSYRREIWALGLRNPWGFAFDSETGDLYVPDVGDTRHEEVNYHPVSGAGGQNYGWPAMEGNICSPFFPSSCRADGLTLPVAAYGHSQGCAIVGGVLYRGAKHPEMQGTFFYGDFCSGRVWGLKRQGESPGDPGLKAWQSELLLQAESAIPMSKIGVDQEGNLYALGYLVGAIYEITEK